MRTLRSVVAIVSTAMLIACQTAASGMNQTPAPVTSAQTFHTASTHRTSVAASESNTTAPVAAEGSHRKTWIIVALVAAIAIVAVIVASGGSDGGGIY